MNRFEKKCFVGSATFHGVLLAVIFLGAAFSSNKAPSDAGPVVTMIPNPGAAPSGNGTPPPAAPPARPAPPEPEPPQVKPEQVKQPDPEPVKPKLSRRDEPKETEDKKGELPVPVKKPTDKKLAKEPQKTNAPASLITKTLVRQKDFVDPQAKQRAEAQRKKELQMAQAAQAADAAQRAADIAAINSIVKGGNGTGLGHSRVVSPNSIGGGGGDGVASGRYGDGLKAIYDSKWILNADAFDDEASATVRVTVRRDGTVVSSAITKPSGNASFDRSVRSVLNNVTRVPPFTPDMKDSERVFTWRFEKRTKAG